MTQSTRDRKGLSYIGIIEYEKVDNSCRCVYLQRKRNEKE